MSNRTPKLAKAWLDKKMIAAQMPALVAALALLSTSLRVTQAFQEDMDGNVNSSDTLTEHPEIVARNNAPASRQRTSATIKFTTTVKDKVETYSTYRQRLQRNQQNVAPPMGGGRRNK